MTIHTGYSDFFKFCSKIKKVGIYSKPKLFYAQIICKAKNRDRNHYATDTVTPAMRDITTREDVKLLVDSFYDKALKDALLGPVFTDVAKIDLATHLPRLYAFWEMLLLGSGDYSGQPFPRHIHLGLTPAHFERWLALFRQTLQENFSGVSAAMAMQKASGIARLFEHKLSGLDAGA